MARALWLVAMQTQYLRESRSSIGHLVASNNIWRHYHTNARTCSVSTNLWRTTTSRWMKTVVHGRPSSRWQQAHLSNGLTLYKTCHYVEIELLMPDFATLSISLSHALSLSLSIYIYILYYIYIYNYMCKYIYTYSLSLSNSLSRKPFLSQIRPKLYIWQ